MRSRVYDMSLKQRVAISNKCARPRKNAKEKRKKEYARVGFILVARKYSTKILFAA